MTNRIYTYSVPCYKICSIQKRKVKVILDKRKVKVNLDKRKVKVNLDKRKVKVNLDNQIAQSEKGKKLHFPKFEWN